MSDTLQPIAPNATPAEMTAWVVRLYPRFPLLTDEQVQQGVADELCRALLHVLLTHPYAEDDPILDEMASHLAGLDSDTHDLWQWHRLLSTYAEFVEVQKR
ncbi:hypothetical protein ACFT9I_27135 [Streptomyces sp. NPDC057137]|uniref:hypothetical protein n=1 Tax=Streptomyces sp. NPDC057137 TaxID=3346030 RepID=UPI00362AFE6C